MSQEELSERVAEYAHTAWSGWMGYAFAKGTVNPDGSVTIPAELVERWKRQINTSYSNLPENEKESDRAEANKILIIIFDGMVSKIPGQIMVMKQGELEEICDLARNVPFTPTIRSIMLKLLWEIIRLRDVLKKYRQEIAE